AMTSTSIGKKLVHLDLKGAPPRISYLAQLFPLFSKLGADGLLVEYEDMFPYGGILEVLRAKHAYSPDEIKQIQHLAKSSGLEVIPLIQTFGHMEFVLKHRQFSDLREVSFYPSAINPHRQQSLELLQAITDQVMALHPEAQCLHLGADEVHLLGQGEESQQWLSLHGNNVDGLYLSHMKNVAEQVLSAHPHLTLIMWDDMLRGMSQDFLRESGIAGLVQPMIWDYNPALNVEQTVHLIEKYQQSGLSKLWVASSFKGSTEVNQCLTCIDNHVANHMQWLKVVSALPEGMVEIQGIAVTGWQRYDHFSVLCELLPVGLPSLAACLQTLHHGVFTDNAQETFRQCLGISSLETDTFVRQDFGSFPGSNVAQLVTQITAYLKPSVDRVLEGNRYAAGWFSPYHRKRKFVHPVMVQQFEPEARGLLLKWESMIEELRVVMGLLYYPDTVEEWLEEYANPVLDCLRSFLRDLQETVELLQ
uniref:beta-N-acetylhexosaminidase n=1 Tax=Lepisosteus oculatus TaxID=7918 RepID=W5N1I5_LEPOC